MNSIHLMSLVECLLKSHAIAKQFNTDSTQRAILWKASFKGNRKPNLLKQETNSVHGALNILFRLYSETIDEVMAQQYRGGILKLVCFDHCFH